VGNDPADVERICLMGLRSHTLPNIGQPALQILAHGLLRRGDVSTLLLESKRGLQLLANSRLVLPDRYLRLPPAMLMLARQSPLFCWYMEPSPLPRLPTLYSSI
jgi:hypothetical protein